VDAPSQPLDFRYVAANPAFERHTGLRNVVGKTILQLVPGAEPEVMQIYHEVALTRRPRHFEAHVASLDLWIEADAFPAPAAEQVAVLFSNISIRKRAESALREGEAQMRAIANLVPDLLWRSDAQGQVQWYSERWFDYTGMSRPSALGQGWAEIIHPEDLPGTLEHWHEATRLRQPYRFEHRLRRHDGEYRWFLSRAEPLFDADANVRQWFGSVTDIHEQRCARELLEQRVKARTRDVERASELRRQLLARVETLQDDERRRIARELHDSLGQFLSAMLLSIASFRLQPGDPVVAERFSKLQRLLESADHELDRIVFTLRPTALEDSGLADAVAAYVGTWSELSGQPVDLLIEGLDGRRLPPQAEAAVFRVIQEALNNVAKHAHARNVSVSVEWLGRQLVASVEDDGVGFDAEQAAPADGSRPSWGLLGMRERIEALGGTFAIESRPGQGTTVLLRVPLH
jgi:PAS domain S-box-containing protein